MSEIDPRQFRDACGRFGTGVTVVSTHSEGADHGMTANAFMSISVDPPLIAISIAANAKMLNKIRAAGRFAVSILAHGTEQTAWHFAGRPNEKLGDPFDRKDGLPVIRGAVACFTTDVVNEVIAGDHMIFIGRVKALNFDGECKPLLFFQGKFGGLLDDDRRSELH